MSENENQDIVINGVSVMSISDYAKRRHFTVPFVHSMIKGDDQNSKIEPKFKIGSTGMYAIEELDDAYLTRGSKGFALASMGYAHPSKVKEMDSRIMELIREKTTLAEEATELEEALENMETRLRQALEDAKRAFDELEWTHNFDAQLKAL